MQPYIDPTKTDLVGKTVFLERAQPSKDYSNYNDGELLVIRQTAANLYGTKVSGPYSGFNVYGLGGTSSQRQAYPLVGNGRYNVVSAEDTDWDYVEEQLKRVERDIADVRAGRKEASWVMSIYDNAENEIRSLRRLRDKLDTAWTQKFVSPPLTNITVAYERQRQEQEKQAFGNLPIEGSWYALKRGDLGETVARVKFSDNTVHVQLVGDVKAHITHA